MPERPRLPWLSYLVATAAVALVLLLRLTLLRALGESFPFLPFITAVLVAASYGGLRPGLYATALSALAGLHFFVPPAQSLRLEQTGDVARLITFVGGAALLSSICAALRRYRSQARRQADLLEHVSDAIFGWELGGGVVYWNASAARLYGFTAKEAAGRRPQELLATELPEALGAIVATLKATGEWAGELTHTMRGGRRIIVSTRMVLVTEPDGRRVVLETDRDVTDRRRAEEDLRLSEQTVREADRRKDEFLALLAHELRNPLAPIRNALQILRLSTAPEVGERARATMERQVAQMVRLIDDLLDVSRISRGKLQLRRERVTLTAIVDSALETASPLMEAGGHQLSVALPAEPVYLQADVTRLAQVLSNLLNNSAKYTDRGGHIRLTAERRDGEVVISVRDDGIGIPAEALPHVFDMFSQVDRSLERSQGGLGIGLALVKGLAEMHGGSVEAPL